MLRQQLNDALKTAMRNRDQITLSTIRLILAAIKDRDIQARTQGRADGLSDQEILQLLQTLVKQRREAISLYEKGGRVELCEREQAEIAVIEQFLPRQFSEVETEQAVKELLDELGAHALKDMGRVMSELRGRYAGQMDFGKASSVVKKCLAGS